MTMGRKIETSAVKNSGIPPIMAKLREAISRPGYSWRLLIQLGEFSMIRNALASSALALALITGVTGCSSSSGSDESVDATVAEEATAESDSIDSGNDMSAMPESNEKTVSNLAAFWPSAIPLPEGLEAIGIEDNGDQGILVIFSGVDTEFASLSKYSEALQKAGATREMAVGTADEDIEFLGSDSIQVLFTVDDQQFSVTQVVYVKDGSDDFLSVVLPVALLRTS
jgi:hypothetical protein